MCIRDSYKGWCGLTNYRFYYNSEDQGLLSIPISKIIKYHDYTYSKSEEVELAIEHFKNRGEKFKNHDIVWMTLQGGFDSLYNSGEVLHEKYLKKKTFNKKEEELLIEMAFQMVN